ncbi:hypothetical protein LLG96_06540 [bacterium]|nr:hypothetical protein [bacterium]
MRQRSPFVSFIFIVILLALAAIVYRMLAPSPLIVIYARDASPQEKLAAREIRRYMYLRTGVLPLLQEGDRNTSLTSDLVVVARKDRPAVESLAKDAEFGKKISALGPEHYLIETRESRRRRIVYIIGGSETGTLYGAYRFAEHLGVRFYMHGDVLPDSLSSTALPLVTETGKPLFDTRGIQPFHDFPEGPDWWDVDDYKAILSQLPKMGMNFFGLHTYPEGAPNAEPTVWIGLPGDIGKNAAVAFSYPSSYQNTLRGNWGYAPKKTGEYAFGGSLLFGRDDYGNDVMSDMCPASDTPEDCNEVFRREGAVLGEAFRFAHVLGVRTCIGTETPLKIPQRVQERLKSMGKNPADSAVVEELYEGLFRRAADVAPIDYYWFWTPEDWTWRGNTDAEMRATAVDFGAAITAHGKAGSPFTLATCGWVLGPRNDRAFFDNMLPKTMPMSCINRGVGTVAVDRAFARVTGRPKWAIPWLEDDPGLTSPQLWVGRMRCDAAEALRYGCTGLLGIHWRTRVLGPNVSALARAAWSQEPWNKEPRVSGALEGHVMKPSDRPIDGTTDDILYQTGRSHMYNYRITAPKGTYTVTLRFCELEFMRRGARVFDVYIQDEKVLDRLDIFARAGGYRALDLSFENVKSGDGFIDITFETIVPVGVPVYGQACISAIEVQGGGFSWKENCGGPAYRDFQADSAVTGSARINRDYLRDTSQWEYAPARHLPALDFYEDWALYQFGPEASGEIAAIFTRMDGALPRSSDWINGPGGWKPDTIFWEQRARDYVFVEELEKLESKIRGAGNRERFLYWLNTFRYMRSSAHLCCSWAEFNRELETIKAERNKDTRVLLARENGIPLYIELGKLFGETYGYLLSTVSTRGEMGTVMNIEQHISPGLLQKTREDLEAILGSPIPDYALPSGDYAGEPRLIVPTVRTVYTAGETMSLTVIVLDKKQPRDAGLYWREMGTGVFAPEKLSHTARGVYTAQFPPSGSKAADIEYYVKVTAEDGKELYFPATAPAMNQTVVMMEK